METPFEPVLFIAGGGCVKQTPLEECVKKDIELRENLSEKQIDKMVEDTFPASDPPSTY